jgi:hypothetical protein
MARFIKLFQMRSSKSLFTSAVLSLGLLACGGATATVEDLGNDAADSGALDGGAESLDSQNCDQVTISMEGPVSSAIEQGKEAQLLCFGLTASCKDQVLKTLKTNVLGLIDEKNNTSSYNLQVGGKKLAIWKIPRSLPVKFFSII